MRVRVQVCLYAISAESYLASRVRTHRDVSGVAMRATHIVCYQNHLRPSRTAICERMIAGRG